MTVRGFIFSIVASLALLAQAGTLRAGSGAVVVSADGTVGHVGCREVTAQTEAAPPAAWTYLISATSVGSISDCKTAYALIAHRPQEGEDSESGDRLKMMALLRSEVAGIGSRQPLAVTKIGASRTHWSKPRLQPAAAPKSGMETRLVKQAGLSDNHRFTTGIAVGDPRDTDFAIASEIAAALGQETTHREAVLQVAPTVGRGGVQTIRDVLTLPSTDMAIVPVVLINRLRLAKDFGDIASELVSIAPLFVEELHVLAPTNISDIRDLAGKTVSMDGKDSTTAILGRQVLASLGIEVSEVNVDLDTALEGMRAGQISAALLFSGKPVRYLAMRTLSTGFHFLAVPYVPALQEDYVPAVLGHDEYPNLIDASAAVETIGVDSALMAYNWPSPSERFRLLELFVQRLAARLPELRSGTHHPKWREVNLTRTVPGWARFNPGAQSPDAAPLVLTDPARDKSLLSAAQQVTPNPLISTHPDAENSRVGRPSGHFMPTDIAAPSTLEVDKRAEASSAASRGSPRNAAQVAAQAGSEAGGEGHTGYLARARQVDTNVPVPSDIRTALLDAGRQVTSVAFHMMVGEHIPEDVYLEAIPAEIIDRVPDLGGQSYIVVGGKIIVANPYTRTIVRIIGSQG